MTRNNFLTQTPLTRACQFGHEDIVSFLLNEGAEVHPLALVKAIEGLYKYANYHSTIIYFFVID